MVKKTFGFSLDDTLIFNKHYYSLAQAELISHIMGELGPRAPNAPTILGIQGRWDREKVEKYGLRKDNFPSSFYDTYLEVARSMGVSLRKSKPGALKAYGLGEKVFDSSYWVPTLIPGVEKTLDFLVNRGASLFLLTIGDEEVQSSKIDFYNLRKWFGDNVYIAREAMKPPFSEGVNLVVKAKQEELGKICSKMDKKNTWFVGDSWEEDVMPALKSGIGAIHIISHSWPLGKYNFSEVSGLRSRSFNSFGKIISRYSCLK